MGGEVMLMQEVTSRTMRSSPLRCSFHHTGKNGHLKHFSAARRRAMRVPCFRGLFARTSKSRVPPRKHESLEGSHAFGVEAGGCTSQRGSPESMARGASTLLRSVANQIRLFGGPVQLRQARATLGHPFSIAFVTGRFGRSVARACSS